MSLRDLLQQNTNDEIVQPPGMSAEGKARSAPQESGDVRLKLGDAKMAASSGLKEATDGCDSVSSAAESAAKAASLDLKRSVTLVGVDDGLSGQRVPDNLAKKIALGSPERLLSVSGATVPIYGRQTSSMRHLPLYFADPNLERCGSSVGVAQNSLSAARFLWSAATLPIQLLEDRPNTLICRDPECRCGGSDRCP